MRITSFGACFKHHRIQLGVTLREFCEEHGFDAGNISKLERGILPPPSSRQMIEHYASILKLEEGSDDWYVFFDLASSEKGRIPEDLLEDEEFSRRLPVFLRTIRNRRLTPEQLDDLVAMIKHA